MFIARVLAMSALALLTPAAGATDRYFPDSSALSPNGRYRIDAKSPDNAGPRRRPFAANFTYTLTDTSTGSVLWERKQPMTRSKGSSYVYPGEPSPIGLFVNDEGLVAARTSHDTLILLDPADGRKRAEADVLNAFPQDQHHKHVSQTTAGPIWCGGSDWFFVSLPADGAIPAATFFVVRPRWGHRLIIDTATGAHFDPGTHRTATSDAALAGAGAEVRRVITAVIAEEKRRATASLTGAAERLKTDKDWAEYRAVRAALRTVQFLKLDAAGPLLRDMERALTASKRPQDALLAATRETLRALGLTPAPGAGVPLYVMADQGNYWKPDTTRPHTLHVPVAQRTANAPKIRRDMTVAHMTTLIGCPDAAVFDGEHGYDYDIDAPEPYTLRVFFDRRAETVTRFKIIKPFAFLHDEARMREW